MLSPGGRALPGTFLGQRLQAQPGAKWASWRHTNLRQAPRLRSGGRRGQTGKAAAPGKERRAAETQGTRSKQRPLKRGACSRRGGSWAGVSTGGACMAGCVLLSTCPGGQDGGGLGGGAAGAGDVGSGRRQAEGCGHRDSSTRARLQLEGRGSLPSGLVPGPRGPPGQSSRTHPGPGSTGIRRGTSRARVTTRQVSSGAALAVAPCPMPHRHPCARKGLSCTARTVGALLGPRHPARRPVPRGQSRPEGTQASGADTTLESHPCPP